MRPFQKFIVFSTGFLLVLNIFMVTFYAYYDYEFQLTDAFENIRDLTVYDINTHYVKPLVDFLTGLGMSYLIYCLLMKVKGEQRQKMVSD